MKNHCKRDKLDGPWQSKADGNEEAVDDRTGSGGWLGCGPDGRDARDQPDDGLQTVVAPVGKRRLRAGASVQRAAAAATHPGDAGQAWTAPPRRPMRYVREHPGEWVHLDIG